VTVASGAPRWNAQLDWPAVVPICMICDALVAAARNARWLESVGDSAGNPSASA
jgi:hypothetical protein